MKTSMFLVVDLFCGAGGVSTGFVQAKLEGINVAEVIACVNHDPIAIKSHWANHPEVKHFEEDIRTLDLTELKYLVETNKYVLNDNQPKVILWASLECTNFSKAKGGQPRDADSRTLADHLERYITALNPDYVMIENVVEFMSWGPLDDKGKPVSRKNGSDWMRWCKEICAMGYYNEWKELNSANFGAYTSRNRLFGVFPKHGLPVAWPEATHSKAPSKLSMHGDLKKWKAVKEVLNFSDEGESIFNRKKPLSDKTYERVYAGLVKYVAKGDTSFISKYYSGRPAGKVTSVNDPAGTITTVGGQTLVQPEFLLKYNSMDGKGQHTPPSVDEPCPTVACQPRLGLVQPEFLAAYYGNGDNVSSIENPCPTVPTKDRFGLVKPVCLLKYDSTDKTGKHYPPSIDNPSPVIIAQGRLGLIQAEYLVNYNHSSKTNDINDPAPTLLTRDKLGLVKPEYFIDKHFGTAQNQSIDQPAGSIMPTDKHRLVEAVPFIMPTAYDNKPKSVEEPAPTLTANRKHHYIVNPSHGGNNTSTDKPCPVIIARQDKAPLYLIQAEEGEVKIPVYDYDTEIVIKIKYFMVIYKLIDIKMRMLRVLELLRIQGFPAAYKLEGNQSDQKKFIGNSVVPQVVKVWIEAMAQKLIDEQKVKAA